MFYVIQKTVLLLPKEYLMYQVQFTSPIHVHFIGIGGISMSSLAEILMTNGFPVSGSDMKASELTEHLKNKGARIFIGQRAENITEDIDLVVYTAAIRKDNPEYTRVLELQIPMLTRAELLGQIMKNYPVPIAVSGTHGKTTTTSMASLVLMEAGKDPTVSVGGILPEIGGNLRLGHSDTFITEACEYTNSFLSFFPKISIILNVDADHLDFFKDIDDIRSSFHRFALLLPEDGVLIINADTPKTDVVTRDVKCEIITYSLRGNGDYTARDISYDANGCATFTACFRGETVGTFTLHVPGLHNVSNALSVIAMAVRLGIDTAAIQRGFLAFGGTKRRFEHKGSFNGVTVIDDYAHHPTEIKATLTTARAYPNKKIWCVFQPHTYTRTKALLPDFAEALSLADHVVLADIYAAREKNTIGISSKDLQKLVAGRGTPCDYFPSFEEIQNFLKASCQEGDLLITMGAGDVVTVGENLLK